jgi:hypothetical protein
MFEIAIVAVATYLGRKAGGLLTRAGSDLDAAIDKKAGQLYDFVKAKLISLGTRGERALQALEERPDDERNRAHVVEDVTDAIKSDPASIEALQKMIDELTALDPHGSYLRGYAVADEVEAGGRNVGTDVEGTLGDGDRVEGTASARVVRGENIGTRYRPSQ